MRLLSSGNIEAYKNCYSKRLVEYKNFPKIKDLGFDLYYITLTGNKFFNENEFPRYMIIYENEDNPEDPKNGPLVLREEEGKPLYYDTVAYRNFIYGVSDTRSNQVAVYINPKILEEKDINSTTQNTIKYTLTLATMKKNL